MSAWSNALHGATLKVGIAVLEGPPPPSCSSPVHPPLPTPDPPPFRLGRRVCFPLFPMVSFYAHLT